MRECSITRVENGWIANVVVRGADPAPENPEGLKQEIWVFEKGQDLMDKLSSVVLRTEAEKQGLVIAHPASQQLQSPEA